MSFKQSAKQVIDIEANALSTLHKALNDTFDKACSLLLDCKGKIIVIGLGKSGHIGNKLAATLASTGSSAFFVHAAEAAHGDLGMIQSDDVILALSNSGNTEEVVSLLPTLQALAIPIISITNNPQSKLAKAAHVNLHLHVEQEACPLGLAPTASTTATLVLGDAIAISLLSARGFKESDFAFSHPSGSLGKRLLLTVDDLMTQGEAIPKIKSGTLFPEGVLEISAKRLGMAIIENNDTTLAGVLTDGDIRRAFEQKIDMYHTPVEKIMTQNPKTIENTALAIDALSIMRTFKITSLVVTPVGQPEKIHGVIHIHHLLQAGLD